MRVVIVGQAPSRSSRGKRPFEGASGRRIAALAGLGSYEALAGRCVLVNLLRRWPGAAPSGKGDAFPWRRAERAARDLAAQVAPGDVVVLAGRNVARCFGLRATTFFGRVALGGAEAYVVPHPSGVSHWWNDAGNRKAAAEFFRRVVG